MKIAGKMSGNPKVSVYYLLILVLQTSYPDPAMYDASEGSGYQLVLDRNYGADRSQDPNLVSTILRVRSHRANAKTKATSLRWVISISIVLFT